jgi:hypothetical protein
MPVFVVLRHCSPSRTNQAFGPGMRVDNAEVAGLKIGHQSLDAVRGCLTRRGSRPTVGDVCRRGDWRSVAAFGCH